MFEDKTYDAILADMLSNFGADVRTDEGSLAYNACCKIALKLEEVYADLNDLYSNLDPETMDLATLITFGTERSITYAEATACVAKGVFAQAMTIGDLLVCGNYSYSVTELLDDTTHTYSLTCQTEGAAPNTNLGELDPEDYIDDYESGEITEIITLGTDDEEEDHYRARVLNSFADKPFAGNRAAYREYVDAIDGVGACSTFRESSDDYNVVLRILASDYSMPTSTLVSNVQTLVDPSQGTSEAGSGRGIAPIGHVVLIEAPEDYEVSVTATVTLETGYTLDDVTPTVKTALTNYMLSKRKQWEYLDEADDSIKKSAVEALIVNVQGVSDCTSLTFSVSVDGGSATTYTESFPVPAKGAVFFGTLTLTE